MMDRRNLCKKESDRLSLKFIGNPGNIGSLGRCEARKIIAK
jgi:hypothetical protein